MIGPYSPHKCSKWQIQRSCDLGIYVFIKFFFRPVTSCYVEEEVRRNERGEGEREQMMASWLLVARDSPWF